MIIGAFPSASHEGYVYIRHEVTPWPVENVKTASSRPSPRACWALNILGQRLPLQGEGQPRGRLFVCGESTALMASSKASGRAAREIRSYIREGLYNARRT